jgi:hypothetical protein
MATFLSYRAGFELLALWVGLPAVLPLSFWNRLGTRHAATG